MVKTKPSVPNGGKTTLQSTCPSVNKNFVILILIGKGAHMASLPLLENSLHTCLSLFFVASRITSFLLPLEFF